MISGIVQVLKSGYRWKDAAPDYGPDKTLYNGFVRWRAKGVWENAFTALAAAGGPPAEVLFESTHVKAHRSAAGGKRGALAQAIGVSRDGQKTEIHALSDGAGRPIGFLRTGGNAADAPQAAVLLESLQVGAMVMADKAYDANAIRRFTESQGAIPKCLSGNMLNPLNEL